MKMCLHVSVHTWGPKQMPAFFPSLVLVLTLPGDRTSHGIGSLLIRLGELWALRIHLSSAPRGCWRFGFSFSVCRPLHLATKPSA